MICFVVQDLVLRVHTVRYRRERWLTPDGAAVTAALPAEVTGHFGPALRRFMLAQHHQGQVTVARLLDQVRAIGIDMSKRHLVRLLIDGQDLFHNEARDVLRAGLETARWITVDDTGARHRSRNGFCTQIGNDDFTWFGTTGSKSRLNFLECLSAGHTDYVINDAALAYMRERSLSCSALALLANHAVRQFADEAAFTAHLRALGLAGLKVTPDPVGIATEGALWGAITAHGFLRDAVVVSDDAGQLNVGHHPCGGFSNLLRRSRTQASSALCWVHAAQGPARRAWSDLVVLPRPARLQARPHGAAQGRDEGALRTHLQTRDRLRHAGSAAQKAARQQGRVAGRARPA